MTHDTNITALQSSVDYIVTREQDELLKKWVMIGHHYFSSAKLDERNDCSEINITCERGDITIEREGKYGTEFVMKQTAETGHIDEITLLPCIDREDALRIAGMLIAWAADKNIHGKITLVGATNEGENEAS